MVSAMEVGYYPTYIQSCLHCEFAERRKVEIVSFHFIYCFKTSACPSDKSSPIMYTQYSVQLNFPSLHCYWHVPPIITISSSLSPTSSASHHPTPNWILSFTFGH